MADRDFVVKNGLRTVGNTIVANSSQISLNSNVVIDSAASLSANGSVGAAGQYLLSNGSGVYWATVAAGVNTAAQYAWTNTHSFSNVVTFNANLVVNNSLVANGGVGTSGQVLTSNGSTGSPYWSTVVGVNTAASYTFTNTIIFTNTITTNGRLILDNIVTANGSNGTPGQVLTSNSLGVYWSSAATGTVTSVDSGSGLGGGPVNTTGTLFVVANTGIVANSTGVFVSNTYVNTSANFTVNGSLTFSNVSTFNSNVVFGRAISANGGYGTAGQALISGGGTTNNYWSSVVTSVSITANQLSATFSGANPTLGLVSLANVVAGAYTLATVTVDSFGRIAGIANGSGGASGVTSVANGVNMIVSGTGTGPYTGAVTVSMATGGAGACTYGGSGVSGFTLDAYGRVTGVTTATYLTSAVTSVAAGNGITKSGTTSVTISANVGNGINAASGALVVQPANGISVGSGGVAVTAANGIAVSSGGVRVVNADNTLAVTSSGVFVNTSSLLATTGDFSKSSGTTTFANTVTFARGSGGSGGIEGGQIHLEKPASSTSLSSNVAIDVYGNLVRFFEEQVSATGRGYYLDLTYAASSSCSAIVVTPTATSSTTTNYPIGTILCVGGADGYNAASSTFAMNNDVGTVYTGTSGPLGPTLNSYASGSALSGTWRSRGVAGKEVAGTGCCSTTYYWYLIQRTA